MDPARPAPLRVPGPDMAMHSRWISPIAFSRTSGSIDWSLQYTCLQALRLVSVPTLVTLGNLSQILLAVGDRVLRRIPLDR